MDEKDQKQISKEYALESIITASVRLPGVKVNRDGFLAEIFSRENVEIQKIIDLGPIEAGITREELYKIATKLILKRTSQSSIASFTAGLPGGMAMAATIPADVLQFFGMSIKLAQELSYLYGSQNLWQDGKIDENRVRNQLIMYCGVMFGASGAVSGVRVLTTQLVKTTVKKLPQKALTKTFWYPIVKQIGKMLSVKVTKSTVTKGLSKAVPVMGGVISGALNFASMMPMANRLLKTLDKACFDYSEEEFDLDIETIGKISVEDEPTEENQGFDFDDIKEKVSSGAKNIGNTVQNAFGKIKGSVNFKSLKSKKADSEYDEAIKTVEKLAQLKDSGIITPEEFETKKRELLKL